VTAATSEPHRPFSETRVEVVTAGEAMGLLLAVDGFPLTQASSFRRSVAGSESNVAIGLARLGHQVAFLGRIGADAVGTWVRATLAAEEIDVRLEVDADRPTGLILRDLSTGRPSSVAYYRAYSAATALGPRDVDRALLDSARMVFISGITALLSASCAAFVAEFLDQAIAAGTHVVFDPNVRFRIATESEWRRSFDRVVGRMDTLVISADELKLLGGARSATELLTGRTTAVVVTDGARGATAFTHDGEVHETIREVPVVDTVGAGDAFTAGWMSAILRGCNVPTALSEAVAVASMAVAVPSDLGGLPSSAERDATFVAGADVDR
jgi:2-dehydro-3-deoxygluconokinase